MARVAVAILLVLAVAGASARPGPAVNVNEWAHDFVDSIKGLSGQRAEETTLEKLASGGGEHERSHKFTLLTKHIVRPSVAKPFVKEWLKVREDAVNASGNIHFTLSKPLTDNLVFYGWQQWESKAAFFEWIKESSDAKALAEWIEEKDIPIFLTQLVPIPAHKPHHHHGDHNTLQGAAKPLRIIEDMLSDVADSFQSLLQPADADVAAADFTQKGHHPSSAIILTKFIVKPSELFEFVKASSLITKAVREEEGNLVYGFSAELGNDYTLWNYAVWEGKEAVEKHLSTSYARKFLEFVLENDILTSTTILFPIESLDE